MKNDGQNFCNTHAICALFKTSYPTGKLNTILRIMQLSILPYEVNSEVSSDIYKRSDRSPSVRKAGPLRQLFFDYVWNTEWNWEGDMSVADVEDLRYVGASEILFKMLNCAMYFSVQSNPVIVSQVRRVYIS